MGNDFTVAVNIALCYIYPFSSFILNVKLGKSIPSLSPASLRTPETGLQIRQEPNASPRTPKANMGALNVCLTILQILNPLIHGLHEAFLIFTTVVWTSNLNSRTAIISKISYSTMPMISKRLAPLTFVTCIISSLIWWTSMSKFIVIYRSRPHCQRGCFRVSIAIGV